MMTRLDERLMVISFRAPFGSSGNRYRWYTREWVGNKAQLNPVEVEFSRKSVIENILKAVNDLHGNPKQTYLIGIGQGAVIASCVLLSNPCLIAGLVMIHGAIPAEQRMYLKHPEQICNFPVLILQGQQNPIFKAQDARNTSLYLSTLLANVRYREYPIEHLFSIEALNECCAWISARLDEAGVHAISIPLNYHVQLQSVNIKVVDLERAIDFYVQYLGMSVIERTGKVFAFLSNNEMHQIIGIECIGAQSTNPGGNSLNKITIRFEAQDRESFARAYQALVHGKIPVSLIDHSVCWSMNFKDTEGNDLEIFLDTRNFPGKSHLWQGRDLPLDENEIINGII